MAPTEFDGRSDYFGFIDNGIAHTTLTFALITSAVNGTDKGRGSGQADLRYKAGKLLK